MRNNPIKHRLADGGSAFGTMVFEFFTPGMAQIAAAAGAEFVLYDMEHSGTGSVFAFVEGGVADPAQHFQVPAQCADVGPGDFVRLPIEVLCAQADEARQNGVDLTVEDDESREGSAVVLGLAHRLAPSRGAIHALNRIGAKQ
jgi:hypothetical protein